MNIKDVWVATAQIRYSPPQKKTIWIHPRLVILLTGRRVDFCKGWMPAAEGSRVVEIRNPWFFFFKRLRRDISQNAPEWDWNLYMNGLKMDGWNMVAETYASPIRRICEMLEVTAWCFKQKTLGRIGHDSHKDRFDFRDKNVNQLFLYVRQFGCGTNDMQHRTTKSKPMLFLGVPRDIYGIGAISGPHGAAASATC